MRRFIFPADESDPEIRSELALQGRTGLVTLALIGGLLAAAGLVNSAITLTTSAGLIPRDAVHVALQNQILVFTACLGLYALNRIRPSLAVARTAAIGLVFVVGALLLRPEILGRFVTAPAALAFVYLLVVALMPLRPISALALGLALTGLFVWASSGVDQELELQRAVPAFINGSVAGLVLSGMLYQVRRRLAEGQVAAHHYAAELERTNEALHDTRLQLVQSEKMASLGNLAAGVAHEINTPMGAIKANAELAEKALDRLASALDDGDTEAAAKPLSALRSTSAVTREATQRIVRIVRSLKSFARLDEAEEAWTDLNDCVKDTMPLLQHEVKEGIDLALDLGELSKVRCHPNQINQVIMNVVLNAIQAVPETGRVSIRTRSHGDSVVLEVEDDGVGIHPEHERRIFDPGFTTKGVGVGTGLGLSISYRIIDAHGGTMRVETELGRGTSMKVILPRTGPAVP